MWSLKNNNLRRPCQSGFSLLEVIIAAGILSIVTLAAVSFWQNQQNFITHAKTKLALIEKQEELNDIVKSSAILAFSANQGSANQKLHNCLPARYVGCTGGVDYNGQCRDTAVAECTTSSVWQPFSVFDPVSNRKISGTQTDPVFYRRDNRPCSAGSPACFYQVTTEFQSRCPNGASKCAAAQNLVVKYTIKPVLSHYKGRSLSYVEIAKTREIEFGIEGIWTRMNQSCPPDYAVKGISYDYKVICIDEAGDTLNAQIVP